MSASVFSLSEQLPTRLLELARPLLRVKDFYHVANEVYNGVSTPALRDLCACITEEAVPHALCPLPLKLPLLLVKFIAAIPSAKWEAMRCTVRQANANRWDYTYTYSHEALIELVDDVYAHVFGPEVELDRILDWVLGRMSFSRILDFGAGCGRLALAAADKGSTVTAIEANPLKKDFLEFLSDSAQVCALSTIAGDGYDCCTLINVLDHLDDPVNIVANVHNVIQANGILLEFNIFPEDGAHNSGDLVTKSLKATLNDLFERVAMPSQFSSIPLHMYVRKNSHVASRRAIGPSVETPHSCSDGREGLKSLHKHIFPDPREAEACLNYAERLLHLGYWTATEYLTKHVSDVTPYNALAMGLETAARYEAAVSADENPPNPIDDLIMVLDDVSVGLGIPANVLEEVATQLRNTVQFELNPTLKATRVGVQSSDLSSLNVPFIEYLRCILNSAINSYFSDFLGISPAEEHYLLRFWAVDMMPFGRQTPHNHPDGIISGVYYVSTPLNNAADSKENACSPLIFIPSPISSYKLDHTFTVQSLTDRCVVFPSYIWHYVPSSRNNGGRLSIAFDVLPITAN